MLVSNVMLLGDEALGGKLSLEIVAFESGVCTQLKGPHLSIFSLRGNGRSNQSETREVLPRARVYWVALTVDFRLPGPRGRWVSNLVLTSNPSSSELFLVNVSKVLCFKHLLPPLASTLCSQHIIHRKKLNTTIKPQGAVL